MKYLLSHFSLTAKNVTAIATAVLGFLVLKGRISSEEMAAYLLIVGSLLGALSPSRPKQPDAPVDKPKDGGYVTLGGSDLDIPPTVPPIPTVPPPVEGTEKNP